MATLPPKRQMTFDTQTVPVTVNHYIPKTLELFFIRQNVSNDGVCPATAVWTNWPTVVWERRV
jgi:hypothetical protein